MTFIGVSSAFMTPHLVDLSSPSILSRIGLSNSAEARTTFERSCGERGIPSAASFAEYLYKGTPNSNFFAITSAAREGVAGECPNGPEDGFS